jgi:protocatechuate 3,4-dioxygenase beta subunit
MNEAFNPSRRSFVKSALALGALVATEFLKPASVPAACALTPPETEGPFYPLNFPLDKDNDLTFLKNQPQKAQGEVIWVQGRVQDEACQPVPGALVEIWQACTTGRYNHPGDRNPAKLDPNFQYWGKATTNEKGEYSFKTIKPGSYPVSWFWTRPPHIHFTVHSRGHSELTTQMYFAGEPLNRKDRLFRDHTPEEQAQCLVSFRRVKNVPVGIFNLTLK